MILHCRMSGDWSGEISWFVPPLSLSQLCQIDHKKQFIKNLSNSEDGISKTKEKFLTTTLITFFINNKTHCTYFNPFMSGGINMSNILKQTYSQKLLFMLSLYDLFLPPGMRVLKGGTTKENSFCEFLTLALFIKKIWFVINSKKCRFTFKRIGQSLKPSNSFSFQTNRTKEFEKLCVTC